MRTLILLLVAAVTAVAFGPWFFQATLGEKAVPVPLVVAAVPEATPEVFPENLTGEVISVDEGARQITVKRTKWFASKQVTFAVAEPAAPVLAELQPGDWVQVGYVKARGHLIARAITKISADRETGQ